MSLFNADSKNPKFGFFNMNENALRKNIALLLEHARQEQLVPTEHPSKLNVRLDYEYSDLLVRLCLLEGVSKSEMIRSALDEVCARYGGSKNYNLRTPLYH